MNSTKASPRQERTKSWRGASQQPPAKPEAWNNEWLKARLAARLGFEPRQTDPESAVLPLHHRASRSDVKLKSLHMESSFVEAWKRGSVEAWKRGSVGAWKGGNVEASGRRASSPDPVFTLQPFNPSTLQPFNPST